jgi:5-deoxy-glucuronate isomerase
VGSPVISPIKIRAKKEYGLNKVINMGIMEYLSLDLLVMSPGDKYSEDTENNEIALIPLKGCVEVTVDNGHQYFLSRKDVFSEKGSGLYVPINSHINYVAVDHLELAICRAKSEQKNNTAYISTSKVKEKNVGKDCWKRRVVDIVDIEVNAQRLIVGETYNESGCWSSFPPHKHDTYIPGIEAKMEEIYLFIVDPPEGFGMQRLYSELNEFDISLSVESYDVVAIPSGYHPVVSIPGYKLYYLWFLAGNDRTLMPNTDPKFKWLLNG